MDKVKSMLRISGIINCIIGVIAIKIPVFSWLLIILGCILYLTYLAYIQFNSHIK